MILYGPRIVTVIGQLKATAPQQVVTVNLCRRRRVTQSDGDIHRIEKLAAMPPIWVSEDLKKKPDADGLAPAHSQLRESGTDCAKIPGINV